MNSTEKLDLHERIDLGVRRGVGIDREDNVKSLRKIAQNSEKRIFKVGGMLSRRVAK
jgi:hypothetical protein